MDGVAGISLVLGALALACALACAAAAALLARPSRTATPPLALQLLPTVQPPAAAPHPVVLVPPSTTPAWHAPPGMAYVDQGGSGDPLTPDVATVPVAAGVGAGTGTPDRPIVLTGRYPRLGASLAAWLRVEADPVERVRIATDLGSLGTVDAAHGLLDAVRARVLSPTVAADQLERGGFDAGIVVAGAMSDPDPRVRELAASIVSRRVPVVHTRGGR